MERQIAPQVSAGAGKISSGNNRPPRPGQKEIRALGLQAICLSFRAHGTIGHFLYSNSLGINEMDDT
jgi:hypothetical protein